MHAISSVPAAKTTAFFNQAGVSRCMGSHGAPMLYARNTEIYGDGEEAEFIYQVVTGAVRTYKILNDGRRQIVGFYLPGDVFGLEFGEEHESSAEAVSNSTITVVKRSFFVSLADRDLEVARQLWSMTKSGLRRAQKHALLLAQTAQERVAAVLLEMFERSGKLSSFELPMSRQDIADYLGLTIETVSRTVTALEAKGAISLQSARRIAVTNHQALRRLDS